jgi:hypothetical protein
MSELRIDYMILKRILMFNQWFHDKRSSKAEINLFLESSTCPKDPYLVKYKMTQMPNHHMNEETDAPWGHVYQ